MSNIEKKENILDKIKRINPDTKRFILALVGVTIYWLWPFDLIPFNPIDDLIITIGTIGTLGIIQLYKSWVINKI